MNWFNIESIGFRKYPEKDCLKIFFEVILVFSVKGMHFEKDCETPISDVIPFGNNCTVAIANSINDACEVLTGQPFIDKDEKGWISEKRTAPPFLLIYFKESESRLLRGGYRLEKDNWIHLYDGFPEGLPEIRAWQEDLLPNIITSLTVKLSSLERPVELVPVYRNISGTTVDGQNVHAFKMTTSPATLFVSEQKRLDEINSLLKESSSSFSKLEKKSIRHLYTAFNEDDKLKQFLNYFHFIERYTHSQYKALSSNRNLSNLINTPSRLSASGSAFFENQFDLSKNLSQRFHWCAIMIWKNIDDSDVDCFLKAKSLRDRISHGEEYEDKSLPVQQLKQLCFKLLGTM